MWEEAKKRKYADLRYIDEYAAHLSRLHELEAAGV